MRKRRSLWWGTLTLTGAAIISRGLGLVYRMLLARFLGSEGLGFFQMIFPLYIALVTLAIAGTPVAVSQLVAEGRTNTRSLMKLALLIVLVVSLPLIAIVIALARPLAMALYHDSRFVPLLIILAPGLVAVGFSAVIRGYFVGIQQLTYPAVSQVAEQLIRVMILYTLLNMAGTGLFPNPPMVAVALVPLGEGFSLLILGLAYLHSGKQMPSNSQKNASVLEIMRLSLPVTSSRLLASVAAVIEAFLIPMRLEAAGMTENMAIRYFGQLTGMALPLIFFPTALTLSLSTNLVPIIAQQQASGDFEAIQTSLTESLQATAMFTIPVTILLMALGVRVDDLFFHAHIPPALFYPLVLGGFFLYFDITLSGILRGLGRTDIPMRNDLAASAIEIGLIWLLSIRPHMALVGIPIAISTGFALSMIFNTVSLGHLTKIRIPWHIVMARPLAAVIPAGMVLLLWQVWEESNHMTHVLSLFLSIVFSILAYLIALRVTRQNARHLL